MSASSSSDGSVSGARERRWERILLGAISAFTAMQAIGGGLYGLAGAEGIPLEWLEGTPFHSYLVPSLVLLVVVAGACIAASFTALASFVSASRAAITGAIAGTVLLGWIAVQVAMIGFVSWLQPAMALIGAGMIGLAIAIGRG